MKDKETFYLRVKLGAGSYQPKEQEIENFSPDEAGKTVSAQKLEQVFGEQYRPKIQTFAYWLYKTDNWNKFAVSLAEFPFSTSPKLTFFKIDKILPGEMGVKIIYLGTGGASKNIEIGNEIAAKSWGFAVLNLNPESKTKLI